MMNGSVVKAPPPVGRLMETERQQKERLLAQLRELGVEPRVGVTTSVHAALLEPVRRARPIARFDVQDRQLVVKRFFNQIRHGRSHFSNQSRAA